MAKQQQAISNWQLPKYFVEKDKTCYFKTVTDIVVAVYIYSNTIENYGATGHEWSREYSFNQRFIECTREEFLTAYEKVSNNINQLIQE